MRRGAIVTAVLPGDLGKPRPALVIQSDVFNENHPSITVLPMTSTLGNAAVFRVTVEPDADNGLRRASQIMIDKATSIRRERIGSEIGRASDDCMVEVTRALAVWLGIA